MTKCKICKKQLDASSAYMLDKCILCSDCIQVHIDSKCEHDCTNCIYHKTCIKRKQA